MTLESNKLTDNLPNCEHTWLEYVPGVSSLSSTEQGQFKLSFLSSIYSGVLSGIVTGLVVGLVIYRFQKGFEKRQLKTSLEREISVFKEKARVFLAKSGSYQLTDLEKVPEYVELVLDLIESNPLDIWKENLPLHRPLISKLRELQSAYFKFEVAGSHLDAAIRTIIRKHNSSHGTYSMNDDSIYGYYSGKLANMDEEDILAWLDMPKQALGWITLGYSVLINDQKVQELGKSYSEEKQSLESVVSDIRQYLDVPH